MNIKRYLLIFGAIVLAFVSVSAGILTARFMISPFTLGAPGNAVEAVEDDGKVNILLVGRDEVGYNTDLIMVVGIDSKNNKVSVMSLPRDTRVYAAGTYRKINEVYAYAKNTGGKPEELLINSVKDITGVPIHYYAVVNLNVFREVVDMLGGVYYDVPRDYDYDDDYQDLHIHIKEGYQLLDGKNAEGLIRFRADYINGDIERINVQHDFFNEFIRQKMTLKSIGSLPEIYECVSKEIRSNLTLSDITSIAMSAYLSGSDNVRIETIPGEGRYVGDISYYIVHEVGANDLIYEMFGY